jgi:uncharacterized membrane protein
MRLPSSLAECHNGVSNQVNLSSSQDHLSSPAVAHGPSSPERIAAASPIGSALPGSLVERRWAASTESPSHSMSIADLRSLRGTADRDRRQAFIEWGIDALPRDLLAVMLLAVASMTVTLFEGPPLLRIAFGLPTVLFLPGYALVSSFFPAKEALDGIGRVALGFGLSLAVVPPIGLVLDRSPWGLTRLSTALATFIIIAVASIVAASRRVHLTNQEPYAVRLSSPCVPLPGSWDRATQAIVGLVVLGTVLVIIGAAPIVHTQMIGEPLTEFALYNSDGKPEFFPRQVVVDEPIEVQLSVVNNEGARATFGLKVTGSARLIEPISPIRLVDGETWTGKIRFAVTQVGKHLPVQFDLVRLDGSGAADPYRELLLWVDGMEPDVAVMATPHS